MHPLPSQHATTRGQFVCYLRLSAPPHSERPSSASSAAKRCAPSSTPSYCLIKFSITLASKTYSGKQDTLRYLAVLRSTAWSVVHRPSFPSRRRSATSATTSHAIIKHRLCMPRAALATKMMVVLWNRGTYSYTVKMCAVAPPLCRLYKNWLPGLRTLPSFLIAGGGIGFSWSG